MRKTQIGGQAVMEGVMMRGSGSMATAVRDSVGEIEIEAKRITPTAEKNIFYKIPIIRGVLNFVTMLASGTSTLLRSSEVFGDVVEPSKFDKWVSKTFKLDMMKVVIWFSVFLGIALAVGLFVFLPQFLTTLLFKIPALDALTQRDVVFSVIEGAIRLIIFILYVVFCSLVPDVKRVFMYHGAEHKTINAFEHDEELTVENVRKYSTIHKRCGTTFMVLVMIVSILVLALTGWLTSDVFGWPNNFGIKLAVRLVMLPLIAGISYEILKLLAKSDNIIVRIIRWPGLQLQRLTTKQPDDGMLEVAIAAFNKVYQMDNDKSIPECKFEMRQSYADARKQVEETLGANFEKSDVDWILAEVTGKSRASLPLVKSLTKAQVDNAVGFAKERNSGRPLQYVLGYTEFYGLRMNVREGVLIPRPETEYVAEQTIKVAADKKVLDLCTGSGAIAIAVKKNVNCEMTACDISETAAAVANENAELNGVDIDVVVSDLFEKIEGKFDVIVSNPPYVRSGDIASLDDVVKDYEPQNALDGGTDGLDFYRRIAAKSRDYMNENGTLILEIGINEAEAVKDILAEKFGSVEVLKDLEGIDRIVIAK